MRAEGRARQGFGLTSALIPRPLPLLLGGLRVLLRLLGLFLPGVVSLGHGVSFRFDVSVTQVCGKSALVAEVVRVSFRPTGGMTLPGLRSTSCLVSLHRRLDDRSDHVVVRAA